MAFFHFPNNCSSTASSPAGTIYQTLYKGLSPRVWNYYSSLTIHLNISQHRGFPNRVAAPPGPGAERTGQAHAHPRRLPPLAARLVQDKTGSMSSFSTRATPGLCLGFQGWAKVLGILLVHNIKRTRADGFLLFCFLRQGLPE